MSDQNKKPNTPKKSEAKKPEINKPASGSQPGKDQKPKTPEVTNPMPLGSSFKALNDLLSGSDHSGFVEEAFADFMGSSMNMDVLIINNVDNVFFPRHIKGSRGLVQKMDVIIHAAVSANIPVICLNSASNELTEEIYGEKSENLFDSERLLSFQDNEGNFLANKDKLFAQLKKIQDNKRTKYPNDDINVAVMGTEIVPLALMLHDFGTQIHICEDLVAYPSKKLKKASLKMANYYTQSVMTVNSFELLGIVTEAIN